MRQLKLYLVLLLLTAVGCIEASAALPRKSWSNTDGVFYLKERDGLEEYTVDGSITFKCVADGKTIPTYRDAGVVFAPANDGESIQITVNSIDLDGTTNYMCVYDGAIEKIASGASDGNGQSRYLPAGWVYKLGESNVGLTYASQSEDGKMSFGFHSSSANGQTGFTITVTSLSGKDMEYVSATANAGSPDIYRGAAAQAIFGASVVTDGGANPLTLDNLTISTAALAGSTQVENVRLYKGDKFTDDNLVATAATLGDNLTATGVTLKSKENKFWVVADILPDADGTIPSLEVTSLSVAGEARTLAATTATGVVVNNIARIATENKVYTIGDDMLFYDDGGENGKIGSNFEGSITFVPATAGNAIKVDFDKLAIFNTSTTGNNDVFNFYNGRTADEANLITTLLQEAKAVKSTAEDGSMTVTLKSITGIPADGWEAVVSQFLPGDMTFKTINTQSLETATAAAGDKDVKMLLVDVLTDNQSNPLVLSNLNLDAAGTAPMSNLTNVKVYALGEKPEVTTTNLYGEAAGAASMTINGEYTLAEGHNYFAVLATVADEASNGDVLKLAATGATVAGELRTVESPATAEVTINNVCHISQTAHTHNIHDAWVLTDTKSTITPSKYDYVNANHTVTFVPTVENSVIELDFSKFDVTYSSTSYGTKAVFKVYSGNTASDDNLLWELNDASQANVGPGKKLRSSAPNGAMTIVFNPNTTASYYAATGFEATVTPFVNHDMTINGVVVNQTSSDILSTGATDAELIDFNVTTEGTLTLKTLKEVKLNLKDSYEAVEKVTVLYSGDKNSAADAVEFGQATVTGNDVVVAGEKDLADGENHFWVKVDIKNDAEPEVAVDAKLVSLTFTDNTTTAVENGDPEGSRTTKSMLIMANGTQVVTVVKPLMFYDDGGPSENFSKGFNGTVTFVPGKENCGIVINSLSFGTGSSSSNKFGVFNGREADEANRVGSTTEFSATNGPKNIISAAEDGSLTITFTTSSSSYSSTSAGWEIDVRLHEYKPLAVDSITTSAVKTGDVVRGAVNEPMAKVDFKVKDDVNEVNLNDIKFSTAGTTNLADIKAARLYYTNTVNDFSTDNLVAETTAVGEEITFSAAEPIKITERGNYYLWLAYDISGDAVAGNKVAAQFTGCTGATDTTTVEVASISRDIKAGFKGTYIIGKSESANYPTFAAAVAAMSGGIEGAVRFEVEDGTYAENINIENIDGASYEHDITFVGLSGNRDAVVVTGSGNVEQVNVDGSNVKKGMVFVNATPYVTIEGMSFIPASKDYPHVVHYFNKSNNFTLRNCVVQTDPVTSGYSGMNLVRGECTKVNGNLNNNALIENNSLTGGYIGVYAGAYGIVANKREKSLVVRGNTVTNCGSKGIYVLDEIGALIEGNTVAQNVTSKTSYSGMDLYRNEGQFIVRNNIVSNTHTAYSNGIYLRQGSAGYDNAPALIYNNAVTITKSPNNNGAGVQINSDCNNIEFVYNTVRVAGSAGYAFYNGGNNSAWTRIIIANNLFQNVTTSGFGAQFYSDDMVGKATIENNAWYVTSGNIVKEYALTIDALNEHDGNKGNWVEQAEFLSDADLHLKAQGTLNKGTAFPYVTTDADNIARAEQPTVGAYEYVEVVEEKPEIVEGYPVVSNVTETSANVKSNWTVGGKLYAKVVAVPQGEGQPAPAMAPTADEMLAETAVDYIAGNDATSSFTGLEPATAYKAYLMVESALGVKSDVVETEAFTTLRHIEPLELETEALTATINAGESATVIAMATGGDEPYTWEWRDQMNNIVGSDYTADVTPDYTRAYFVTVTSADGQTATAKTAVIVRGEAVTATFDDYYLPEESFVQPVDDDVLYSGSYGFHGYGGSYGTMTYWSGFSFANKTADTFIESDLANEQHNTSMGGGRNSAGYGIAYPYGSYNVDVTHNADGDTISGMYISNNAYALSCIKEGNGVSTAFKQGDWFKVTATGTAADGSTKNVEFYLADYRSTNAADHYALDTWQWMDLRSLGKVKNVVFTMSGSDTGQYGLNTPAYFAMEDFGGVREETEAEVEVSVGSNELDLADYFTPENNGATVTYSMEVVDANETITPALDGDAFTVEATELNQSCTVVIAATQQGKTQYVRLTINVTRSTGVGSIAVSGSETRKIIENGEVIIVKDGVRYNTLGRKLEK